MKISTKWKLFVPNFGVMAIDLPLERWKMRTMTPDERIDYVEALRQQNGLVPGFGAAVLAARELCERESAQAI